MNNESSGSTQTYSVQIEKLAWEELMAVPERMRERLFAALEVLETEPRHARVTQALRL